METTRPRGGARPGSGRKPTRPEGSERWEVWATPEERAALQAHLARLRAGTLPPDPLLILMRGMDAAQAHRPATGCIYLSVGDDGQWTPHAAPMAEEVQLRVPAIGPVELFDDRSG